MELIKKINQNRDKSEHPESYIEDVYDGNISENDEMYQKILNFVKQRCEEYYNITDNNIDAPTAANNFFRTVLDRVQTKNGIDLPFSDIEHFEDEFLTYINGINNIPVDKRVLAIDSLVNMDYMHNPTMGVLEEVRQYVCSELEKFSDLFDLTIEDLEKKTEEETPTYAYPDEDEVFKEFIFDDTEFSETIIEGMPAEEYDIQTEEQEHSELDYKEALEFFKALPQFSKIFEVKAKYRKQALQNREECLVDEIESQNPDYISQLQELVNHPKNKITYYYHGATSVETAAKIANEGLFMQYGQIDRTAKKELSVSDILSYSYGHENAGRHAIVVIAAPHNGGNGIINFNNNNDVQVEGTGQGKEQGSFTPKYVIPNQYIVGYIDKDSRQFVPNEKYKGIGNSKNGYEDCMKDNLVRTSLTNEATRAVNTEVRTNVKSPKDKKNEGR